MELAEIINLVSLAGGSSVITLLANKLVMLKKEKQELEDGATEIAKKQHTYLADINDKLNETIKKLQDVACYSHGCNDRINGLQNNTTIKPKSRLQK